jgi:hypothetical protein
MCGWVCRIPALRGAAADHLVDVAAVERAALPFSVTNSHGAPWAWRGGRASTARARRAPRRRAAASPRLAALADLGPDVELAVAPVHVAQVQPQTSETRRPARCISASIARSRRPVGQSTFGIAISAATSSRGERLRELARRHRRRRQCCLDHRNGRRESCCRSRDRRSSPCRGLRSAGTESCGGRGPALPLAPRSGTPQPRGGRCSGPVRLPAGRALTQPRQVGGEVQRAHVRPLRGHARQPRGGDRGCDARPASRCRRIDGSPTTIRRPSPTTRSPPSPRTSGT